MKQLLAGILLLLGAAGVASADLTTINGDQFTGVQSVSWGGLDSIALTSTSTDTVSDWVNLVSTSGVPYKPGMVMTLDYHAKATDPSTSSLQFLVETQYCRSAPSGCDKFVTFSGEHWINGNQKMTDTLTVSNPHAAYVSSSMTSFFLPEASRIRFRIHIVSIAGGKTVWISGVKLLPQ